MYFFAKINSTGLKHTTDGDVPSTLEIVASSRLRKSRPGRGLSGALGCVLRRGVGVLAAARSCGYPQRDGTGSTAGTTIGSQPSYTTSRDTNCTRVRQATSCTLPTRKSLSNPSHIRRPRFCREGSRITARLALFPAPHELTLPFATMARPITKVAGVSAAQSKHSVQHRANFAVIYRPVTGQRQPPGRVADGFTAHRAAGSM